MRATVLKPMSLMAKAAKPFNKVVNKPMDWAMKGAQKVAKSKAFRSVAKYSGASAVVKATGADKAAKFVWGGAKKVASGAKKVAVAGGNAYATAVEATTGIKKEELKKLATDTLEVASAAAVIVPGAQSAMALKAAAGGWAAGARLGLQQLGAKAAAGYATAKAGVRKIGDSVVSKSVAGWAAAKRGAGKLGEKAASAWSAAKTGTRQFGKNLMQAPSRLADGLKNLPSNVRQSMNRAREFGKNVMQAPSRLGDRMKEGVSRARERIRQLRQRVQVACGPGRRLLQNDGACSLAQRELSKADEVSAARRLIDDKVPSGGFTNAAARGQYAEALQEAKTLNRLRESGAPALEIAATEKKLNNAISQVNALENASKAANVGSKMTNAGYEQIRNLERSILDSRRYLPEMEETYRRLEQAAIRAGSNSIDPDFVRRYGELQRYLKEAPEQLKQLRQQFGQ